MRPGEVVAELKLVLARFLRHVGVGSEAGAIGKGDKRHARSGIYVIVPILEAHGEVIDSVRSKDRAKGKVSKDKVVDSEVTLGQIDLSRGLIVIALVVLCRIADKSLLRWTERMIDAPVITLVVEGRWDRM